MDIKMEYLFIMLVKSTALIPQSGFFLNKVVQ